MMAFNLLDRVINRFASRQPYEKVMAIDGRRMPYLEIDVAEGAGHPLLVGVHGLGASERQMKTLVNITLDVPFTYVAPRALHNHPTGGYSWFPVTFDNGFKFDEELMLEAVDTLAAFVNAAVDRYQADPQRVVFVGYSQGGGLAFAYLLRHPATVAGAVATAGNLFAEVQSWGNAEMLAGKSLFIGHGTLDPFISSVDIQAARHHFEKLGVNVSFHEYRIPHVVSQQEVREMERWLSRLLVPSP